MGQQQYLTEAKAQRWRALAIFKDGSEGLIYLGQSTAEVQERYDETFFDYYDEDERDRVRSIQMQKWVGAPDQGRWENYRVLRIPEPVTLAIGTRPKMAV